MKNDVLKDKKRRQTAKKRQSQELLSLELSTAPELLDNAPTQAGM